MVHRLLPLLVILGFLTYVAFNFQDIKRATVYRLGISGDPTASCCKEEEISQTGDFDESANIAIFNNQVIDYPKTSLSYAASQVSGTEQVLGTTSPEGVEKWIEVSIDEQKVRAWEGNRVV